MNIRLLFSLVKSTFFTFFLTSSFAYAEVEKFTLEVAGDSDSWTSNLVNFLQGIIDFIGGPFVAFIVFSALAFAVLTWISDPRGEGLGRAFRAIIGAMALASINPLMKALGYG